jgi:hypothetical protein
VSDELRAVADVNVLVSAARSPNGLCGRLLDDAIAGRWRPVVSPFKFCVEKDGASLADAEARIMVPREPAPAPDIDYARAGAVGVKVEQSRDGTFQVLP